MKLFSSTYTCISLILTASIHDPENPSVLIEGVLFRAQYLGSTQLISEGQPSKAMRMMQAQEAVGRIKVRRLLMKKARLGMQWKWDLYQIKQPVTDCWNIDSVRSSILLTINQIGLLGIKLPFTEVSNQINSMFYFFLYL